jgi:phosphatidylinositol kinase/protein kinase (PI-3  family)
LHSERTPVLFTSEFLYVMGGYESTQFLRFQEYCSKAFNILRKNAYLIINLLSMMVSACNFSFTQRFLS